MDILSVLSIMNSVSGPSVSQTKCVEYQNIVVSNETVDYAAPGKFPFMVQIYADNSKQFHNGFLISENFVLSTAFPESSESFVMLRHLETSKNTYRPKTYDVVKTFEHPDFNDNNQSLNIKLLKLNESIKFDHDVRPACLPPHDLSNPKNLIQIGWDGINTPTNDNLYQIKSQLLFNKKCKTIYESAGASEFVSGIDNGSTFCAKPKEGERQMFNVVPFGSPVIDSNSNATDGDIIIGFSSYHLKDDNNSIVAFVRVSAFIDWIESIVWHDDSETSPNITTMETPDNTTDSSTVKAEIYDTTSLKISDGEGISNVTKSYPSYSKKTNPFFWIF